MKLDDNTILKYFSKFQTRFDVYCAVCLQIKNKLGVIVPFRFNRCQKVLWQIFLDDLKSGRPIRWYVVKGRQMGTTTFFTALLYWLTTLWGNKNALILNYDDKSAQNLGGKVQEMFQNCRRVMRPVVRKMNREEIHFANPIKIFNETGEIGLNSRIDNNSIDANEIARSYTYQYVLMSEYCLYEKNLKGKTIDDQLTALYQTIPLKPGTCIIKESTPYGDSQAKQDWEENNIFRKIFISWVAEDEYRLDSEPLTLSDMEDSVYGNELNERNNIINQLIFWYPENKDNVIWLESESNARLAWRRYKIDNELHKKKEKFKQEYPTTVYDAFAGKSESIFDGYRIKEMKDVLDNLKITPTKYRYQHDESNEDPTRKFYQSTYGHLHVFQTPQPGTTYVIGGDASQGVEGGDLSTLFVLKLPSLEEVAFFSDTIIPERFAGVANYLGLLYNKALLGIEINDKGGFAAISHLKSVYHYPNLYYRLGNSNSTRTIQYGYITNDITRQMMINDAMSLVKDGSITIKSKGVLDQMETFVENHKTGKCEAAPGKHDDAVMAMMISIQLARTVKTFEPIPTTGVRKYSLDWWVQQTKDGRKRERMLA